MMNLSNEKHFCILAWPMWKCLIPLIDKVLKLDVAIIVCIRTTLLGFISFFGDPFFLSVW